MSLNYRCHHVDISYIDYTLNALQLLMYSRCSLSDTCTHCYLYNVVILLFLYMELIGLQILYLILM